MCDKKIIAPNKIKMFFTTNHSSIINYNESKNDETYINLFTRPIMYYKSIKSHNINKKPIKNDISFNHLLNHCIYDKTNIYNGFRITNDLKYELYKYRIRKLKIKEPVKISTWDDCGDRIDEIKEKINLLKIKKPVKNSNWMDYDD